MPRIRCSEYADLDCGENCDESAGRVQSSLDDLDKQGIPQPIYTLKWENKKLKRVSLKISISTTTKQIKRFSIIKQKLIIRISMKWGNI